MLVMKGLNVVEMDPEEQRIAWSRGSTSLEFMTALDFLMVRAQ